MERLEKQKNQGEPSLWEEMKITAIEATRLYFEPITWFIGLIRKLIRKLRKELKQN
jgi:hypothetical protein